MLSYLLLIFYVSVQFQPAIFDSYRLNYYVIPKHYDLKILTSIEDEIIYTGTLEIVTQCINATNKISLHRDWSIKFDKIQLNEINAPQDYKTSSEVPLQDILFSNKMEFLTISTKKMLQENQYYLIHFEFKGQLFDKPIGIFRGNFSCSSGTCYYAITAFEPMGARKAFPCFDEPGMTATFKLSIGRKANYKTTSNMQQLKSESVEGRDGWYWDHFMNSFPMSSYLVCFMIYDAQFVWTGNQEDKMKILARKDMNSSMNMITKTSPKLLLHFQKYFQVPYPFPKLDLIALPHVIGGKDTISPPGFVIIHEKLLFNEPFSMKQDNMQEILFGVSQKIAFQWISLVAVDWWTDIWIQNGLTHYNTLHALSNLSESQSIERDMSDALIQYFHNVGLPFSEVVYGDFASVTAKLATIDYIKCGLLIRMALHLAGDIAIKDITSSFLKKNSFQRVTEKEFWKFLEDFSSKGTYIREDSLDDIMKSWTTQSSFPVVQVLRNYKSNTATLMQKSHYRHDNKKLPCWLIPITYTTNSESRILNTNIREWLRCPNGTVNIGPFPPSDWLLLNINVNSLYRVEYDLENWNLLRSTLKDPTLFERIPPLNRMQLVDDLFEFTIRGDRNVNLEFFLEFMKFLKFDRHYSTWAAFAQNMFMFRWRLNTSKEAVNLLNSYVQNLLVSHYRKINFDMKENSVLNVSFSTIVADTSCFFKLPDCLKDVNILFKKYRAAKFPFHVSYPFSTDLRGVVFCYGIMYGEKEDFNFLLSVFTKSRNAFEREDMLRGLYCTQDTTLFNKIDINQRESKTLRQFRDKTEKRLERNDAAVRLSKRQSSTSSEENTSEAEIFVSTEELANSTSVESTTVDSVEASTRGSTHMSNTAISEDVSDVTGSSFMPTPTSDPGVSGTPSDISSPPGYSLPPNPPGGLGNIEQSIFDSDGPDLNYIILRGNINIVSNLFYRKISTIPLSKSLRYIWLFTERINEQKELENFQNYFEEHNAIFNEVEQQIKDRIEYVKDNLKLQHDENIDVIEALRKNLGNENQMKSVSIIIMVNKSCKMSIIIEIVMVFLSI